MSNMKRLLMGLSMGLGWSLLVFGMDFAPTSIKWGMAACQGRRPSMEDFYTVKVNDEKKYTLFGVFDGHCGAYTAQELSNKLHIYFKVERMGAVSISEALKQAFLKIEDTKSG